MATTAKRMKTWKSKIVPGKAYPIEEALGLVKEFAKAKFDEAVDVAVNLGIDATKSDQQVRGSTVMPNGIGKTVRVAVFTSGKNQEAAKAAPALTEASETWYRLSAVRERLRSTQILADERRRLLGSSEVTESPSSDPDDLDAQAQTRALATVVSTWGSSPRPVGSQLGVNEQGEMVGSVSGGCIEGAVVKEALEVMAGAPPKLLDYGVSNEQAWEVGLACGGNVKVYVERLEPEA